MKIKKSSKKYALKKMFLIEDFITIVFPHVITSMSHRLYVRHSYLATSVVENSPPYQIGWGSTG